MGRKRKNGEGTVRLRKDGRWEGRVVIGYDENGLPKTKNVLAKTKGECLEKLKALKSTITPDTPVKLKADMPFGEWLDYWYESYCKPNVRPGTQSNYEGYIRWYLRPKLGSIPLNKLTVSDIQQMCTWMMTEARIDQKNGNGGLSDSQVRNCYSLCERILEKAVSVNLIARNPAKGCKLPPIRRNEMKILSREDMQKVLIQAKEENYYELFLLEFATGLRLGELMALQWDDVNLTTGELRINKQANLAGSKLVISEPKTKAAVRKENPLTDFQPVMRRTRKPGTGCITEINDHLFEGRYSPTWPDGTKHSKCVYAHTREECEEKLKVLIQQLNTERKAILDRLRGIPSPEKLTKKQRQIWEYMKIYPDETNYSIIAKGAKVTRHTVSKHFEMIQKMLGIQKTAPHPLLDCQTVPLMV